MMSFGEVNFPSSRAFWDECEEDDDDEVDNTIKKLELTYEAGYSKDTVISTDLMLLLEGAYVVEFADKVLLNHATKVCSIPVNSSALYVNGDILMAVLEEDLTNSGEVTELLLPYIKNAKRVITVSIKPKMDYKTENWNAICNEITFLRGINTQLPNVVELETPNFIVGVSAGAASWRENAELPVSSYVAYTDKIALDKLAAHPILNLLQDLNVRCISSYTPKPKDDMHLYC